MSENQISIVIKATDLSTEVMTRVRDKAKEMGDEIGKAGGQSTKVSALKTALDDLLPSTSNAKHAFSDMHATISDIWENPTAQVKTFAGAIGQDLVGGLGAAGIAAGVTAGAIVAAVAIGGAALFELATKAAAAGASLGDMADTTGMSVPGLSRLSHQATVAGADLGMLTNTVFMLERKMGEGGEAFEKALKKMGLSTAELKAAGPDNYLQLVAHGLAGIADPAERAAAGNAILGKSFRESAAALQDLDKAAALTNDMEVWTAAQADQAEDAEMKIAALKLRFEELSITAGKELLPALNLLLDILPDIARETALSADGGLAFGVVLAGWRGQADMAAAALDVLLGRIEKLPDVTGPAKNGVDAWKESIGKLQLASKSTAQALIDEEIAGRALDRQHTVLKATYDKGAAAAKIFGDAMEELNSSGEGWRGTLDTIDGSVVESIKGYLDAGVAQNALATAYGLTATQIKAVVSAMKEEEAEQKVLDGIHKASFDESLRHQKLFKDEQQRLLKERNQSVIDGLKQTEEAERAYNDEVMKMTLSTTDYEIAKVYEWEAAQLAAFSGTAAQWEAFYATIQATTEMRVRNIVQANDPIAQDWKRLTDDMHADWVNLFDALPHGAHSALDAVKKLFGDLRDDVLKIFSDILRGWVEGLLARMLGGGQAAQPGLAGVFAGLMPHGSGATTTSGSSLGGLLGSLFGHGDGSTPIQAGAFNDAGEWVTKAGSGLGSAARFGGGGALAVSGGIELMSAKGKLANTLAGAQMGAGIGTMIMPGIGTAIGAGAGALVGLLKGLLTGGPSKEEQAGRSDVRGFEQEIAGSLTAQQRAAAGGESWKMTLIGVRDAYLKVGKTAAEAERDVAAMWAAEKNGPAAVAAAMKPMHDAFALLDKDHALLAKYGVAWTELGADAKASHIREETQGLLLDFAGLQRQGLDNPTILQHTHAQFSSLYQDIVKAGVDAPESLRELFQPLIDMGLLVDADGKKVTDLANIHFAAATKAADGLKAAIYGLPRQIDIDVDFTSGPFPTAPGAPGFREGDEYPGHATGGLFAVPHLARIAENEPEIIGDQGFMTRAIEGALRRMQPAPAPAASIWQPGAQAGPPGIVINGPVAFPMTMQFPADVVQADRSRFITWQLEALRDDEKGLRTAYERLVLKTLAVG